MDVSEYYPEDSGKGNLIAEALRESRKYADLRVLESGILEESLRSFTEAIEKAFGCGEILECLDAYIFEDEAIPEEEQMQRREDAARQFMREVNWKRLTEKTGEILQEGDKRKRFLLVLHLLLETAFPGEDPDAVRLEKLPLGFFSDYFEYEGAVVVRDPEALGKPDTQKKIAKSRGGGISVQDWFDIVMGEEELEQAIAEHLEVKIGLAAMVRHPGHLHEWLMISRMVNAKRIGFTWEDVKAYRTKTCQCTFFIPGTKKIGSHGGDGSGGMHRDLAGCFDADKGERFLENLIAFRKKYYPQGCGAAVPEALERLCEKAGQM